jgi:hypothetical protein
MRKILFSSLFLITAACAGDAPPSTGSGDSITYVDTDGDGQGDGVDTNGDGQPDFNIASCASCLPGQGPVCTNPLVDVDGDGAPDGLDLDCDGIIDVPFDNGGGNTGGSNVSQCDSTVNVNGTEKNVSCTSENGGPATCECRVNDQLVQTCTNATVDCSIGVPGANCCNL